MDRGTIFGARIEIHPGGEESFIAVVVGLGGEMSFGFTNITDLMRWLNDHAEGFRARKANGAPAEEDDVLVREKGAGVNIQKADA